MAANSLPPTRRRISSGSRNCLCWGGPSRAIANSTASRCWTNCEFSCPSGSQSDTSPPKRAMESAAATVLLPTPISVTQRRSAPPAIASIPKAIVAAQAASSSASAAAMSGVGRSSARSKTLRPTLLCMAARETGLPPAATSSTMSWVALMGSTVTPRSTILWLAAKTATSGCVMAGAVFPCQAASHSATSPKCPSPAVAACTASPASISGSGGPSIRRRISSNGRPVAARAICCLQDPNTGFRCWMAIPAPGLSLKFS